LFAALFDIINTVAIHAFHGAPVGMGKGRPLLVPKIKMMTNDDISAPFEDIKRF